MQDDQAAGGTHSFFKRANNIDSYASTGIFGYNLPKTGDVPSKFARYVTEYSHLSKLGISAELRLMKQLEDRVQQIRKEEEQTQLRYQQHCEEAAKPRRSESSLSTFIWAPATLATIVAAFVYRERFLALVPTLAKDAYTATKATGLTGTATKATAYQAAQVTTRVASSLARIARGG